MPLGQGIDAKNVYLGIPTAKDFDTAVAALGASGVDFGDQEGDAKAIIAYINRQGGVLGRKLVPVFHDNQTVQTAANPAVAGQTNCTAFTQDTRVAAVMNTILQQNYTFFDCLKKAGVPQVALHPYPVDTILEKKYPSTFFAGGFRTERYVPGLIARQEAQRYFQGWDTLNGKPGTAPVKVGIEYQAGAAVDKRFAEQLARELRGRGIDVAPIEEGSAANTSQLQSLALRWKSAGVTHAYIDNTTTNYMFMQAAENQRYRPRYAASAYASNTALLEQLAPKAQLRGMLGIGGAPNADVQPSNNPGDLTASTPLCRRILRDARLTYAPGSVAEALGFVYCDGIRTIAAALNASRSSSAPRFTAAFGPAARQIPSAGLFGNGWSRPAQSQVTLSRDLAFLDSCSCFRYLSRTNYPS